MKPLRLTMQAFGPFAQKETVDFERLPARAPFTISGPTGAGKTSLLDAICFALFGETSGGERKSGEMRSHYAEKQVPTEVCLTFALGADVWRVTRRPKVGEGNGQGEFAELEQQIDATNWQSTMHKLKEIDKKIKDLLGFDVGQFRQVVVLPQGAFRQLLTASSTQREAILKQLFGTHLYERVQKVLTEQATALGQQCGQVQTRRQTLLETHGVKTVPEVNLLEISVSQQTDRAKKTAIAMARVREQAEANLQAGVQAQQKLADQRKAADVLANILLEQPEQQARLDAIQAAQKAQAVEASHAVVQAAQANVLELNKQVDIGLDRRNELLPQDAACQAALVAQQQRQGERDQWMAQASELEKKRSKVKELDAATLQTVAHKKGLAQQQAAVQRQDKAVRDLEISLPTLRDQSQRLQTLAAGLAGKRAHVEKLKRVQGLHRSWQAELGKVVELNNAVAMANMTVDGANDQAHKAARAHDACDFAWIRGQASRLATALVDGEPCVVCGSCTHPAPAPTAATTPTDAQLAQSKAVSTQAQAAAADAAQGLAVIKARLVAVQEAVIKAENDFLAEGVALEDASDGAVQTAVTAVQQAQRAEAGLGAAQLAVDKAEKDLDQGRVQLGVLQQALGVGQTELAVLDQKIAELEKDLPDSCRTLAALDLAHARCVDQAKQLADGLQEAQRKATTIAGELTAAVAKLEAAQHSLDQARQHDERTTQARTKILEQQGFASLQAWQAVRLSPTDLGLRQTEAAAWQNRLAKLRGIAEKAAEVAAGIAAPALPELQALADQARSADEAAQQARAESGERLRQLRRTIAQLHELDLESGELERRYSVVKGLAATCSGENPKGLPLQRFVLAGLLDDVLRAASVRLVQMTRGRYSLLRKEEITDKRFSFGLDLEVLDAYTGQQRPATTLSGGEGFLASLALALGLSDVVQGYSGGIRLDALFIDEGFGALDTDTLELAIQALVELTSGPAAAGRMVGVISHVPELKARLAKGIEVELRADGLGSSVRVLA